MNPSGENISSEWISFAKLSTSKGLHIAVINFIDGNNKALETKIVDEESLENAQKLFHEANCNVNQFYGFYPLHAKNNSENLSKELSNPISFHIRLEINIVFININIHCIFLFWSHINTYNYSYNHLVTN